MTDTKHSAGAVRAAEKIATTVQGFVNDCMEVVDPNYKIPDIRAIVLSGCASVIDRETKCGEMATELERVKRLAHDVIESAGRPPEYPKFVYVDDDLLGKLGEAIGYPLASEKENNDGI